MRYPVFMSKQEQIDELGRLVLERRDLVCVIACLESRLKRSAEHLRTVAHGLSDTATGNKVGDMLYPREDGRIGGDPGSPETSEIVYDALPSTESLAGDLDKLHRSRERLAEIEAALK